MIDKKLTLRSILIIVGTIIAPMTGFRIWKIGPGEVICLLCGLSTFEDIRFLNINNIFVKFWGIFLAVTSVGTFWGILYYPEETFPIQMVTWVYLAIVCICLSLVILKEPYERIYLIISYISYGAVIWYMFLFLYSKYVSFYFFGAPLWYNNTRFTGGATNPHQVAILLCISAVILIGLLLDRNNFWSFLLRIPLLVGALFLLSKTESSTAIMAVWVGVIIVIWKTIEKKTGNNNMYIPSSIMILLLVLLFYGEAIYNSFMDWVEADPNGVGRFHIFSTFPINFFKSPLFGLGPGNHALDGLMEFHNTYLEILAMSGIIGGIVFLIFTIRLIRLLNHEPVSIGVMTSLYVYGFAGFGMRRLVYWMVIVLVYALAVTNSYSSQYNQGYEKKSKYIK